MGKTLLMSHDQFQEFLASEWDSQKILWEKAKPLIDRKRGYLVFDDTLLDKPYSNKMNPVYWQWSGNHKAVMKGINKTTLLWTDGKARIPFDFRLYDKANDGKTKNVLAREMIFHARERGFEPELTMFDSWFSGKDNLKQLQEYNWKFLSEVKCNRTIDGRRVDELEIPELGKIAHLKSFGTIKVFKKPFRNEWRYYVTNDLKMTFEQFKEHWENRWKIEEYHREVKQFCQIARCQARLKQSQEHHIVCSMVAFLKFEINRLKRGISFNEQKLLPIRNEIRLATWRPAFTWA
jgi:hypothetical protein